MSDGKSLKQRVLEAEEERDYYRSLCEAFLLGQVQGKGSLQHHIFAQWGRKRLEEAERNSQLAALLRKN